MNQKSLAVFLLAALLLGGCRVQDVTTDPPPDGGGGGGGGGGATPTAGAAAAAAQDAITGMNIGFLGLINNKPSTRSLEKDPPADLGLSVRGFMEGVGEVQKLSVSPTNDLSQAICTGGGTAVSTQGIDASGFTLTLQFDHCLILSQGATLNLTLKMLFPEIPPLPVSAGLCNGLKVNTEANGTRSTFGTDFDQSITFAEYRINLTSNGCDSNGIPNDFFLDASGALAFDDNLNGANSFDLNGIELSVSASPVTGGSALLLDGTFQDTTSCFDGSVSVDATVPVVYSAGFGFCPNSGVLAVSGIVPGTVTYTGGGEVRVENGGEVTHYDSCQEVAACR